MRSHSTIIVRVDETGTLHYVEDGPRISHHRPHRRISVSSSISISPDTKTEPETYE